MYITTAISRLTRGFTRSATQFSRKPALFAALAAIVAVSLFSISSATQIVDVANLKVARVGPRSSSPEKWKSPDRGRVGCRR